MLLAAAAALGACDRDPPRPEAPSPASTIIARYEGGAVTLEEVRREAKRLPPDLRQQFESEKGEEEFALSLVDRRLLAAEARRRGVDRDEAIVRQVRELEERLIIQALLADEDQHATPLSEDELRAFFEKHKDDFQQPERVQVRRFLAKVAQSGPAPERARARARAEGVLRKAKAGASFEALAADGDGPERARGGDLGMVARNDDVDFRLLNAAFALPRPDALSGVVEVSEGFAVLKLVARYPSRLPAFEEVRAEVETRARPGTQRRSFDALRRRLREQAKVELETSVSR